MGKLPQLVHQKPKAAPLDKGHQHVNAVGGDDLLFELRVHLGLMDSSGKQAALGDGGLRPSQIGSCIAYRQPWILLPNKRKKLLRPLINAQRGKVSFFRCILDEVYDLVGKADLGRDVPAVVHHILQTLLHHICQILRQHLGGFCLVDGRNRFACVGNFHKLAVQSGIDDLFIEAREEHIRYTSSLPCCISGFSFGVTLWRYGSVLYMIVNSELITICYYLGGTSVKKMFVI